MGRREARSRKLTRITRAFFLGNLCLAGFSATVLQLVQACLHLMGMGFSKSGLFGSLPHLGHLWVRCTGYTRGYPTQLRSRSLTFDGRPHPGTTLQEMDESPKSSSRGCRSPSAEFWILPSARSRTLQVGEKFRRSSGRLSGSFSMNFPVFRFHPNPG